MSEHTVPRVVCNGCTFVVVDGNTDDTHEGLAEFLKSQGWRLSEEGSPRVEHFCPECTGDIADDSAIGNPARFKTAPPANEREAAGAVQAGMYRFTDLRGFRDD